MPSETLLHHAPCEACGSGDACAVYGDGHTHCFSCQHHTGPTGEAPGGRPQGKARDKGFLTGAYEDLAKRKLNETTCRKYGYMVGGSGKDRYHIAPYYNAAGELVAQKIRYPDKTFNVRGSMKDAPLFGARIWDGGRKLVITEGEIDCLAVSQAQGNKWPCVSVPNGASGAKKALEKNLEYLARFDEIVLMFDMDEPGRKAAAECAELLPPGKAKIASLPFKDAGECLVNGQEAEIISAIFNAKAYRPDGLVTIDDLLPELDKPVEEGLPWFLPSLTAVTFGRRPGEVYGLGAGTGIGKTDFFTQQMEYDISALGQRVGAIYLEQKPLETVIRVAGKMAGKRFHVPDGQWTPEERKLAVELLRDKLLSYDNFGQTDWQVVANKIRYMAKAEGIRLFYVDHLTAMADTANERESLEQIMKEMAGLANELQVIIHFISHLATPEGKPHEEGGRVTIRHFKGSRSIGFWAHFLFGMERDQQHENEELRQVTTFRVLKDRYTGQATGATFWLKYDADTGRLVQTDEPDKAGKYGFTGEDTDDEVPF